MGTECTAPDKPFLLSGLLKELEHKMTLNQDCHKAAFSFQTFIFEQETITKVESDHQEFNNEFYFDLNLCCSIFEQFLPF